MGLKRVMINPTKAVILAGDLSLNGAAFVKMINGKMQEAWYLTETRRPKKTNKVSPIIMDKKVKEIDLARNMFHAQIARQLIKKVKPDYVAFENYSFGSKGNRAYQIGEMGFAYRSAVAKKHIPLRLYEPDRIKLFGTGDGGAQKSGMVAACIKKWENIDFSNFGKNGEDLADAYITAQLLTMELMLQSGKVDIKTLPKYIINIFTKTTPKSPIPLINRAFIEIPEIEVKL